MAAKKEMEYRFLLVGKSGSGKSSTANNIMGENMFPVSTGLAAGTKTCEVRKSTKPQKGITFRIVDTPGLFDPKRSNEEIGEEIIKASAYLHPGPHAILYVLQIDRYTPEERETFDRLEKLFDSDILKYVIIIFTREDELKKKKMSLQELVQNADQPFKEVLQKCGGRVLAFNNVKRDPKHTKELVALVDKIWKENGEAPYACHVQKDVNVKLERTVTFRTQERIENDPVLRKMFAGMAEQARKAMKEAEDQHQRVEEIKSQRKMTETVIAEKTAAKEMEERQRKQREEKEKQEREEKEKRDLEERTKKEREEELKREKEKKAEEEKARRQQQEELEKLQKENARLKTEQEVKQKLKEEKRKMQEKFEKKLEEEQEKYAKEEREKFKEEVAQNKQTHWIADIAGGLWKAGKGWFGF